MEPWEEIREIQGTLMIINPKIPKKKQLSFQHTLVTTEDSHICHYC